MRMRGIFTESFFLECCDTGEVVVHSGELVYGNNIFNMP